MLSCYSYLKAKINNILQESMKKKPTVLYSKW